MPQDSSFTTKRPKTLNFQSAKDISRLEGVIIAALRPKILTHEFLNIQRELDSETSKSLSLQSSNMWRLLEIVDDVVPRVGTHRPRPDRLADELSSEEELFYDLLHYVAMFQCIHAHASLLSEKRQRHYSLRLFCLRDSLIDRFAVDEIEFVDKRLAAQYRNLQKSATEALERVMCSATATQPVQRQKSLRMILASRWHRLREKSP